MKSLEAARLYTFVDTAYLNGHDPVFVARELCEGGSDLIQLRAKNATEEHVERLAEAILPVLREAEVPLVINDHWEVAKRVGADYCHLGQEDFFDAGYKNTSELSDSPQIAKIGLSTHSPEQAGRALFANPVYIAIGPVYSTKTKPGARPVTLDYVRWASKNVKIPWFAIGGINFETLDDVLAAGAKRICVVSAILNAPNIAKACREFRQKMGC